jgi:hypothetical protein
MVGPACLRSRPARLIGTRFRCVLSGTAPTRPRGIDRERGVPDESQSLRSKWRLGTRASPHNRTARRLTRVALLGDDWVMTIDGVAGRWPYDNRRDAVEAGRRAARIAASCLTIDLGGAATELESEALLDTARRRDRVGALDSDGRRSGNGPVTVSRQSRPPLDAGVHSAPVWGCSP